MTEEFLIGLGGLFGLLALIIIRVPIAYSMILVALVGIMLQSGFTLATIKLVAILVFMLLTGPTASYALANAALLSGMDPDNGRIDSDEQTS